MSETAEYQIEPLTALHGHTSPETAYVVEDYPYGFRLRCKIRYWLETAAKGTHRGEVRFMSQTTNPKVAGEVWNKPKASTYYHFGVMTVKPDGHVGCFTASIYGVSGAGHARMLLSGLYGQLTPGQRASYDTLAAASQHAGLWEPWDSAVAFIAARLNGHGGPPTRDEITAARLYLPEHCYPVAVAAARHQAGVTA